MSLGLVRSLDLSELMLMFGWTPISLILCLAHFVPPEVVVDERPRPLRIFMVSDPGELVMSRVLPLVTAPATNRGSCLPSLLKPQEESHYIVTISFSM